MAHRSGNQHHTKVSRRGMLKTAAAVSITVGTTRAGRAQAGASAPRKGGFVLCLNTSTIRGQEAAIPIAREIEMAAKAGFTAMEPWVREIEAYVKGGGNLRDLRKRFEDHGMAVVDMIGFAPWLMGDAAANKRGVEAMKRDMELVAQIGAQRIAAPPMGATSLSNFDLNLAAERYRTILEVGEQVGVIPMIEVWGHSKTLGTLAEAAYVAVAAKHPKACILTDVYHLYRGGSDFEGLKLIDRAAMPVMHFNDVPANPPREKLKDEHRVYPGDGIAPITEILKTLKAGGGQTALSLELFNREYWKQDPAEVLKVGADKLRAAIAKAGG